MLTLQKKIAFEAGFINRTGFSPSTWLFLSRNDQVFAVDAEQQALRYTLALPGSHTYSKMLIMGDRIIVSRFMDASYVILAYALADGSELWRTTLPFSVKIIFEPFLVEQAAALTILIRTQAFRLDPATGQLLAHQPDLPDEVGEVICPTGTERLYIRYRNSFGFITPDLHATQLLDQSLLEVTANQNQLYLLPRLDKYIAIWDAVQGLETGRIETKPMQISVRSISPLPQSPNRLALRLKNADVAAVLDLPTGSLVWKSRMKAKYLKVEDGFGAYLLTPVERGLVVTLWSGGSDDEISVLCNPETGEELFSFGMGKIRHASVPGYHLTHDKSGLRIYTYSDAPPTSTGFMTLR